MAFTMGFSTSNKDIGMTKNVICGSLESDSTSRLHVSSSSKVIEVTASDMNDNDNDNGIQIREEESAKEKSNMILNDIISGERDMPQWYYDEYQEELYDDEEEDDDPTALDPETLGKWTPDDLEGRLEYEWDPSKHDDPNILDPKFEHLQESEIPLDEEGVELGYDPIFGHSNPFDYRTIINPQDSYMIDDQTRNDDMVTPTFPPKDIEIELNDGITKFRKSLKIIETHIDPYLDIEVPTHTAKWYGYPEQSNYPTKTGKRQYENYFTDPEKRTNFDAMTPHRARKRAIELARAKNNEWLPEGASVAFHNARTDAFTRHGLTVGSLLPGPIDDAIASKITPALDILGNVVDLLEIIDNTIFRFHYHGLIKNKAGMAAWTQTLIEDCGLECTGVVFETGWRKRDPGYDGGDKWFGPY
eukprot:CAMPEP_0184869402 /NCGR_PEP_ID=MMETSP0580-20130426/33902_1 /TAXON_ID=1118495 /ORGANISM="Dactyliosolen fragilissimus" /LENGTH=415 /DNA_ID=CAMNT_0027370865 /DNA_START=66 /DNA_END=1313 /DNA_ORIENTATION=+